MEWISVKDQLPDLNIVVRIKGEDWTDYVINAKRVAYKMSGNKKIDHKRYKGKRWRWVYDGSFCSKEITHWMELPKPPKENT